MQKLNEGQVAAISAMIQKRDEIVGALNEYIQMLGDKHEFDSPIVQQGPDGLYLAEAPSQAEEEAGDE